MNTEREGRSFVDKIFRNKFGGDDLVKHTERRKGFAPISNLLRHCG